MRRRYNPRRPRRARVRAGFTLVELCISMSILCLMLVLAAPIFRRAVEQARVDAASANLRTIWSAQRIYWLENRSFASQLADLRALDLLDAPIAASASNPHAVFVYRVASASASGFVASALRNGSTVWIGQIEIDQEGTLSGTVTGTGGDVLTPTQ